MARKKKCGKRGRRQRGGGALIQPTPQVLQRAARLVLSGKCQLSKPTFSKLKRHRNILRKLAAMKGKLKSKKAFLARHKKQVGGIIGMLPIIAKAAGALLPTLLGSLAYPQHAR